MEPIALLFLPFFLFLFPFLLQHLMFHFHFHLDFPSLLLPSLFLLNFARALAVHTKVEKWFSEQFDYIKKEKIQMVRNPFCEDDPFCASFFLTCGCGSLIDAALIHRSLGGSFIGDGGCFISYR